MRTIDLDHDDIRRARVRLVRALKQSGELSKQAAMEAIGLFPLARSSTVLAVFEEAGNVVVRTDNKGRRGRPRERVVLR